MATPYLDRARLDALLGAGVVSVAEADAGANVDAVIAAMCAMADGYVGKQVALPPSAQAIEQVAPLVAELVYAALYASGGGETAIKRRSEALKALRDIAAGTLALHVEPVADDPNTDEDESAAGGAAFGSAKRLASRTALGGGAVNADW